MKFSTVFLIASCIASGTGHPMMVHPPPMTSDLLRKRDLQQCGRPHHGGRHSMNGNSRDPSFDHDFHHGDPMDRPCDHDRSSDAPDGRKLQMGGRPHHGGNHTMYGNVTFGNHSFHGNHSFDGDHFFHHHNFSMDSNHSCDDDRDGPSMDSFDDEDPDASDAPSTDPGTTDSGTNVLQMQQVSSSSRLQGMAAVASVLYFLI
ncbi:hypothetical protein FisN_11Hh226 [Fistulifera solaris]|uniref:Uncharacterized protein n=1 Tax=Fistulifera solaris TaxID=1519565 RepID=A0A1Z5JKY9_FISSO|nr:hypothetical protein FisN_11Hh226 [Fistulifera solaris]|eukprot:GAX14685.1 hypothetical protein FisN_11Hh226 [Fistulifera solaris]